MRATVVLAAMAVLASGPALGGRLQSCMFEHLHSATSEAAAEGLRLACENRLSVALPADALRQVTGSVSIGPLPTEAPERPGNALFLTLRNDSDYVVLSLDIAVKSATADHIDHVPAFRRMPGSSVHDRAGTSAILAAKAAGSFYAPVDEPAGPATGTIVGAAGFRD